MLVHCSFRFCCWVFTRCEYEAGFPTFGKNSASLFKVYVKAKSKSYILTEGHSASQSWCQAPSGAQDQIFYFQTVEVLSMGGAFSDERTSLSFIAVIAVYDLYVP
jgi:hypothetical protein